jgi:hypothetical protein
MEQRLRNDEIQTVIEKVAAKQVRDFVRPVERQELINEAWIEVLETMAKRPNLNVSEIYTMALRRMLKWKLWMRSAISIPMNSVYEWGFKKGRIVIGEQILPDVHPDVNGQHERMVDIQLCLTKVRARLDSFGQMVLDWVLDGHTVNELICELKTHGFKGARTASYAAHDQIKREWAKEVRV